MVEATLVTFPSDFTWPGRFMIRLDGPNEGGAQTPGPKTRIHDARQLDGMTAAERFERYGFTLLPHTTAITDWDAHDGYAAEVEALIAGHLLPGRRFTVSFSSLARRGRATTNGYGNGVHQDCGLGIDEYQQMIGAYASPEAAVGWRAMYDRDEVEGYMMIDFWRTTNMAGPLRHMPLTVCDPQSVALDDLVPTEIDGLPGARIPPWQMALRRNDGQQWYYYPEMTGDEVLAFKLFESRKSDDAPRLRSCFHTAFDHPDTPRDAEPRQSCEFRIGVWLMKD